MGRCTHTTGFVAPVSPSARRELHTAVAPKIANAQVRPCPLPKAPVLGWRSVLVRGSAGIPSVGELPYQAITTSGRAALLAALKQLGLPAGRAVLVPTYHCPTMVAPVLQAGLVPVFFPIGEDGLPQLDAISSPDATSAGAMFVAHYFGLPKSLHAVQAWCRERGIALIEDCAHCYFGLAGDRPVGHWGDYATASLSKFFPVAEGGMLASVHRPLKPLGLAPQPWRAELKSAVDVIETAFRFKHLPGLSHLLAPVLWLKRRGATAASSVPAADAPPSDEAGFIAICDMGRALQAPTRATATVHSAVAHGRVVRQRRRNFEAYTRELAQAPGARPLAPTLPDACAPYVWPLWVDGEARVDAVYAAMRALRLPVFRWDFIWPGTPHAESDSGPRWSRHVLQMLCHQDLSAQDLRDVTRATLQLLQSHPAGADPKP